MLALGRLPDALDAYDGTVERFPDDVVAWTGRAETLRALGRLRDALDAYDFTVEWFPDDVVARNGRAMVLIDLGRADEARLSLLAAGTAPRQPGDWIAAHVLCMIDPRAGATQALADRLQHLVQTCPYPGQRRYFETTHAVVQLALRLRCRGKTGDPWLARSAGLRGRRAAGAAPDASACRGGPGRFACGPTEPCRCVKRRAVGGTRCPPAATRNRAALRAGRRTAVDPPHRDRGLGSYAFASGRRCMDRAQSEVTSSARLASVAKRPSQQDPKEPVHAH